MSKEIVVQFLGFEAKEIGRAYTFQVLDPSTEPREFTITIAHEAFSTQRARFQDGPDICSTKLRRELIASGNNPTESHFLMTNAELDDYRTSHVSPKTRPFHRPPAEEY